MAKIKFFSVTIFFVIPRKGIQYSDLILLGVYCTKGSNWMHRSRRLSASNLTPVYINIIPASCTFWKSNYFYILSHSNSYNNLLFIYFHIRSALSSHIHGFAVNSRWLWIPFSIQTGFTWIRNQVPLHLWLTS